MQGKIKEFQCPAHPSEVVTRVSKEPGASKVLFCIECVMDGDVDKSNLITLKQLFTDLEKASNKRGSTKIGDKPPDSLTGFLANRDQLATKISTHIQKQKEQVISSIEDLENKIREHIAEAKNKILYDLDKQNELFNQSLKDYERKLGKYFDYGEGSQEEGNQIDQIQKEIEECQSTLDFELKITKFLTLIGEGNQQADEMTILEGLKEEAKSLQKDQHPTATLNLDSAKDSISAMISSIKDGFSDLSSIENGFGPMDMSGLIGKVGYDKVQKQLSLNKSRFEKKFVGKPKATSSDFQKMVDIFNQLRSTGVLVLYELENKKILGYYEKEGSKQDFGFDGKSFYNLPKRNIDDPLPPEKYLLGLMSQILLHDDCVLMAELKHGPAMVTNLPQIKANPHFCYNVEGATMDHDPNNALKGVKGLEVYAVK